MRFIDMVSCYQHYIDNSRAIVSRYKDAVVLKTDGWNETLKDCRCGFEYDMPVLTQIGAKEEYCIEILKDRAEMAQERNPSVHVVNGDMIHYDFGEKKFDVILDLSTIDHVHPDDVHIVLGNYHRWLKDGGTAWIVAWLRYNKRWREVERSHPNTQFHFDMDEFKSLVMQAGFNYDKPELLLGSKALPGLFSFECTKL